MKNKYGVGGPTSNEEENLLVKWIIEEGELVFPVTNSQLIVSSKKLIRYLKRDNIYETTKAFLKRHLEISKRVPHSLSSCRAALTAENIRKWFSKVRKYMTDANIIHIFNEPEPYFNCDESGFLLVAPRQTSFVSKRDKKRLQLNS